MDCAEGQSLTRSSEDIPKHFVTACTTRVWAAAQQGSRGRARRIDQTRGSRVSVAGAVRAVEMAGLVVGASGPASAMESAGFCGCLGAIVARSREMPGTEAVRRLKTTATQDQGRGRTRTFASGVGKGQEEDSTSVEQAGCRGHGDAQRGGRRRDVREADRDSRAKCPAVGQRGRRKRLTPTGDAARAALESRRPRAAGLAQLGHALRDPR